MGWIQRCFETYERNQSEVGRTNLRSGKETPVLLPVAHTTQKVQVEIDLSPEGEFWSARVLRPDEMTTVIPCTEESSARTSTTIAPHALVDKLQYIAGDYKSYGGTKKSGWNKYVTQLHSWCCSPQAHPDVKAVLCYVEKGCLIADLVHSGILFVDASGRLCKKWEGTKEETPSIFGVLVGGDQLETVVRFTVNGNLLSTDRTVWDSFTDYYLTQIKESGWCYVQGKKMPVSQLSPYKIRNAGDRAKLISSNDENNFTFRGRFADAKQALSIGYETTQKAHSALRWLIGRQGIQNGGQTILLWGTEDEPVPDVTADSAELMRSEDTDDTLLEIFTPSRPSFQTREASAQKLNQLIKGYWQKLDPCTRIMVMILDAATAGRLSVRYYRELSGSLFLQNVLDWHTVFAWELRYRKLESEQNGKKISKSIVFLGAPAPADIAQAAYGKNVSAQLKQQTIERLLPCITERKPIPVDLMRMAVRRASRSISLEEWEAKKTRSIACALVRGYYHRNREEGFTMAINNACSDRSYLFGRILACADQLESWSLYNPRMENSHRPTNALRMEAAFVQHPAKTTMLLRQKLIPYLERLIKADKSIYTNQLMLELIDRIPPEEFTDAPLSELYLLGYASQKADFFSKNKNEADAQ